MELFAVWIELTGVTLSHQQIVGSAIAHVLCTAMLQVGLHKLEILEHW